MSVYDVHFLVVHKYCQPLIKKGFEKLVRMSMCNNFEYLNSSCYRNTLTITTNSLLKSVLKFSSVDVFQTVFMFIILFSLFNWSCRSYIISIILQLINVYLLTFHPSSQYWRGGVTFLPETKIDHNSLI